MLPIRKIAPDIVALTSYYGKTFIRRSTKKVNDYSNWLRNQIMAKGLDQTDNTVTKLTPADVFDNTFKCPKVYSIVAQGFKSFVSGDTEYFFDCNQREKQFTSENILKYEKDGMVLCGLTTKNNLIVVDKNDVFYEIVKDNLQLKGTLDSILGIDSMSAPIEFSEVKIFGKTIPVGIVLAYQIGLSKLMDILKVSPRRVPAGQRVNLESHEMSLVFSDETLVFVKDDKLACLILAGFREYSKSIRTYSVYSFDKPNVYLNILESNNIGARYLREIELMNNLFIDPITKQLLEELKEPTTVRGLLVRASELLLTDRHPDAADMRYMRIKGYERLAGAAYTEMVQAIREQKGKTNKAKAAVELHPYAVWKRVVQDPSVNMVSDINPIENLKQMEAVTYSGVGGRNSRSITKSVRAYHPTDMGVISEATVDSSDVSINTYTSADPQFVSLYGITKPYVIGKTGHTALLSTSALISPGSDKDDARRVNFASIQHGHGIACDGYKQSAVRTGYEQVIAHRTSDMYAYTARQDGKVISRNDQGLVIEYKDGTKKGIEIGRRFGAAATGLTIPHDIVSDLQVGDKLIKGQIVSYNKGFFEKDVLNPKAVVWKAGITVKTILYESNQTLEDSSSISKKLSDQLSTRTTKIKTIVATFDQHIKNLVKVGTNVDSKTILCMIEDAVTGNTDLFNETSLNTLSLLSGQSPTAKVTGTIDKIEVFYHGEKEDMSESLREIANASDREMIKRNRSSGKEAFTGSVNDDFRIDRDPLVLDSLAIRIYITSTVTAGVGD